MNPNENQPTSSVDYLNQIAPKTPKKIDFLKQKPIMIGAIVLAVFTIIMIFAAIVGGMSGGTKNIKTLAARLISTENTAISATANLKNSKIRAINSELKNRLINTIRDYTVILNSYKINIEKIDSKITAAESNTKMLATLEDARLNGKYDHIYAIQMTSQLSLILSLMKEIQSTTNKKDLEDFLNNARNNLQPIQKQFSDYNAING